MIEAAMIWNEPNNKSHWDPEIDPDGDCSPTCDRCRQGDPQRQSGDDARARRNVADRPVLAEAD